MHAYGEDLASIHERGFSSLANGAATTLPESLSQAQTAGRTNVDLGCGGGILARRLCAAGYHVIGHDLSEAMVNAAKDLVPEATFLFGSFVDVDFPPCIAVTAIGEVFRVDFLMLQHQSFEAMLPSDANVIIDIGVRSSVPESNLVFARITPANRGSAIRTRTSPAESHPEFCPNRNRSTQWRTAAIDP